jgi:hypothetical protein
VAGARRLELPKSEEIADGDDAVHVTDQRGDGVDVFKRSRQTSKRDDAVGHVDLQIVPWGDVPSLVEHTFDRLPDDGIGPRAARALQG